jgi:hypothetical protein
MSLDEIATKVASLGESVGGLIMGGGRRPFDEIVELDSARASLSFANRVLLEVHAAQGEGVAGQEVVAPSDSASSFLPQLAEFREALQEIVASGKVRTGDGIANVDRALRLLSHAENSVRAAYQIPEDTGSFFRYVAPKRLKLSEDATDVIELEARISGLRARASSLKADIEAIQVRFQKLLERASR